MGLLGSQQDSDHRASTTNYLDLSEISNVLKQKPNNSESNYEYFDLTQIRFPNRKIGRY